MCYRVAVKPYRQLIFVEFSERIFWLILLPSNCTWNLKTPPIRLQYIPLLPKHPFRHNKSASFLLAWRSYQILGDLALIQAT